MRKLGVLHSTQGCHCLPGGISQRCCLAFPGFLKNHHKDYPLIMSVTTVTKATCGNKARRRVPCMCPISGPAASTCYVNLRHVISSGYGYPVGGNQVSRHQVFDKVVLVSKVNGKLSKGCGACVSSFQMVSLVVHCHCVDPLKTVHHQA